MLGVADGLKVIQAGSLHAYLAYVLVFLHAGCAVCRAEGLRALSRVRVSCGGGGTPSVCGGGSATGRGAANTPMASSVRSWFAVIPVEDLRFTNATGAKTSTPLTINGSYIPFARELFDDAVGLTSA